jgi:putative CocE/NonD family hydrolase
MRFETDTPVPIDDNVTEWIEMDDGCRLAVRIWRPRDALDAPVPAIVEMIPYRRRDGTAAGDATRHPYVAGRGYACVRVDIRGTGDSEGVVTDEYTERELQDACNIIAWLAEQPWCTGNVGMWGLSWGGFNSLQVAARNPPALKAIITLCASDDRYADDAHYLGGCLIEANLRWGTRFLSETARPPDPRVVGDRWREMWFERLEGLEFFPDKWLQHQTRDAYWKRASACEDFETITAAVMAVGGWSDAYVNSVGTTLAGLRSPCRGLIGPWGHDYPHTARPAPSIGFLQEAIRWWDHWLKGRDTGLMDEPILKAFVMDGMRPAATRREVSGHWVFNETWPPENFAPRIFALGAEGLVEGQGEGRGAPVVLSHKSPLTTGIEGGEWNTWGAGAEFGGDQRPDDGQSLCFDSAPLERDLELFGGAALELAFSVDQVQANVAVRLCDVWPDGASTRVSLGLLNLTHLDGHEVPQPLVPGKLYRARIKLRDTAYKFTAGHRLRLAISTNYWPLAWPSPLPVTLTVHTAESWLSLPERAAGSGINAYPQFAEPVGAQLVRHEVLVERDSTRTVERDIATGRTRYLVDRNAGAVRLVDTDVVYSSRGTAAFEIAGDDPLSMTHTERQTQVLQFGDCNTRIEAETTLTATAQEFVARGVLEAFENGARIYRKTWESRNNRNFI